MNHHPGRLTHDYRRTWVHLLSVLCPLLLANTGCPNWDPGDDDDTTAGDDDTGGEVELEACDEALQGGIISSDAGCSQLQPYEQFEPNQDTEWQWLESETNGSFDQVIVAPLVINLTDDNGDGVIDDGDVPDVVFACMKDGEYDDGVVRAVSGEDGVEMWTVNDADLRVYPNAHLAAGDLDSNVPGPEIIIITNTDHVVCLDHEGNELWRTDTGENLQRGAPALHDMDGDGSTEVIVGRVILAADGTELGIGEYGYGANEDRGRMTFAVDLDDDGQLEVIAGNAIYDINGNAMWHNEELDGYPAVADFDLDGDPEIVVVSEGTVRLQDHLGTVLWGPVALDGDGRGGPPTIADYDGDGYPEIGAANKNYYTVLDTDGSLLWSRATEETSSGITGSSVFDFNGDGVAEVVYADEVSLYIYQGTDGAILLEETGHTSRTQLEYPVIADIDGDNHAEIILPSNDYFTAGWSGVTVLGSTGEQGWWKARRIWNQHAYFSTHIRDDGTIPASQAQPWKTHNSFRQNFPPDTWEGYPAPNLIIEAVGPCIGPDGEDDVRFGVQVGNDGAADTFANPVVALYSLGTGSEVLLETQTLATPVAPGQLSDPVWIAHDPAAADGHYLVRADDMGMGTGVIVECDEDDNAAVWP